MPHFQNTLRDQLRALPLQAVKQREGCWRKLTFASQAEGDQTIVRLTVRGAHRPELGVLNTYRCLYCRRWHVGHRRSRA